MSIEERMQKYLNQDINNPKYLFHGSPKKLDKIIPNLSYDYTGNSDNIANAVFLFPSLIKASAYAFKDTIKKNSEGLRWHFDIPGNNEYPVMVMENVNIDENIIGYIYVFDYDDKIRKDDGDSLQYKSYEELIPIDVISVCYRDFKEFYYIKNNNRHK